MNCFIERLKNAFSCREHGNGFILSTPIMYSDADHTFSFYIEENENGSFTVNDRGETLDYLRENFSPSKYTKQISAICERFEIALKNGVFYRCLASYESNQTMRGLFTFIGAMNIIANVDLY